MEHILILFHYSLNWTTTAFSWPTINEHIFSHYVYLARHQRHTKDMGSRCHSFLQATFREGREMLSVHPIKAWFTKHKKQTNWVGPSPDHCGSEGVMLGRWHQVKRSQALESSRPYLHSCLGHFEATRTNFTSYRLMVLYMGWFYLSIDCYKDSMGWGG